MASVWLSPNTAVCGTPSIMSYHEMFWSDFQKPLLTFCFNSKGHSIGFKYQVWTWRIFAVPVFGHLPENSYQVFQIKAWHNATDFNGKIPLCLPCAGPLISEKKYLGTFVHNLGLCLIMGMYKSLWHFCVFLVWFGCFGFGFGFSCFSFLTNQRLQVL